MRMADCPTSVVHRLRDDDDKSTEQRYGRRNVNRILQIASQYETSFIELGQALKISDTQAQAIVAALCSEGRLIVTRTVKVTGYRNKVKYVRAVSEEE